MKKAPLTPIPLWMMAYVIGTDLPMYLLKMIDNDTVIPIHRKFSEEWMEYSPYFLVFDLSKD